MYKEEEEEGTTRMKKAKIGGDKMCHFLFSFISFSVCCFLGLMSWWWLRNLNDFGIGNRTD